MKIPSASREDGPPETRNERGELISHRWVKHHQTYFITQTRKLKNEIKYTDHHTRNTVRYRRSTNSTIGYRLAMEYSINRTGQKEVLLRTPGQQFQLAKTYYPFWANKLSLHNLAKALATRREYCPLS